MQLDARKLDPLPVADDAKPPYGFACESDHAGRTVRILSSHLRLGPRHVAASELGLVEVGGPPTLRASRLDHDVRQEPNIARLRWAYPVVPRMVGAGTRYGRHV